MLIFAKISNNHHITMDFNNINIITMDFNNINI